MMDQALGNPSENRVGPGVTPEQIRVAVERSGYPLQTIVAECLRRHFGVQEEWSYVDRDSGELRSMDMRAEMALYDWKSQPRVRPRLTMLVECKQSQLPYVFFETEAPVGLREHPKIVGLHQPAISITTDDDASTWTLGIIDALNLHKHNFQAAPMFCRTLSKCVRKGSDLELSGTDAYSGLVLPLIKSLEHLTRSEAPPKTAFYFDAHLSVALGVLDAPMIIARGGKGGSRLELIPWVRVLRHEYSTESSGQQGNRQWVIDVVHREFLDTYIDTHLLPFAHDFAARVLAHPTEIATGRGFASGLGADSWNCIEKRLKPRTGAAGVRRGSAFFRGLFSFVRGKWK